MKHFLCTAAAVIFTAAAAFPALINDKAIKSIERGEEYFTVDSPFDFNKDWGEGKGCFQIVREFINEPSEHFHEISNTSQKILKVGFNPFENKGKMNGGKIPKGIPRKIRRIIKETAAMDRFFKDTYENLSGEIKEKKEETGTLQLFNLYKDLPFASAFKCFETIVKDLKNVCWDEFEEHDEDGFLFIGDPKSAKGKDYLLIVDRSAGNINMKPIEGAARVYIKTGSAKEISGDPATTFCGVAIFINTRENDTLYSGERQSSATLGFSYLQDLHGNDTYQGTEFTQSSAAFGAAYLIDNEGNDHYIADRYSQAAAFSCGLAVLDDIKGNDIYTIRKTHLHEPLYSDRYQSLSQGFSIGDRYADIAGGIALLSDREGHDRYDAEVYAQGAGYWYALGMLWDRSGNDSYNAHIYGQGGGIHLAAGILADGQGSDTYSLLDGVGMGGGHDLAVGILIDSGEENDAFQGSGITMGAGHANGVGLFYNEGGNDSYSGVKKLIIGDGSADRGTSSFGLFIDVAGDDAYTDRDAKNNKVWIRNSLGVGIDEE